MDNEIIKRVLKLKEVFKLKSNGELADFLSIHRSNFYNMVNGNREFGEGLVNKVCLEHNISKEWLMSGTGEIFESETDAVEIKYSRQIDELSGTIEAQQKLILEQSEKLISLQLEVYKKDRTIELLKNQLKDVKAGSSAI